MKKRLKVKMTKKNAVRLLQDRSQLSNELYLALNENQTLKNTVRKLTEERHQLMMERSRLTDGSLTSCHLNQLVMTGDGEVVQYPSWDVSMNIRLLPHEIFENPDFVYWQIESAMYNFLELIHKEWQERKTTFVVKPPMISDSMKERYCFSWNLDNEPNGMRIHPIEHRHMFPQASCRHN